MKTHTIFVSCNIHIIYVTNNNPKCSVWLGHYLFPSWRVGNLQHIVFGTTKLLNKTACLDWTGLDWTHWWTTNRGHCTELCWEKTSNAFHKLTGSPERTSSTCFRKGFQGQQQSVCELSFPGTNLNMRCEARHRWTGWDICSATLTLDSTHTWLFLISEHQERFISNS